MKSTSRKEKTQIALKTLAAVKARAGRFLKKMKPGTFRGKPISCSHSDKSEEAYVVVDDATALDKTKQAFRHQASRGMKDYAEGHDSVSLNDLPGLHESVKLSLSTVQTSTLPGTSGLRANPPTYEDFRQFSTSPLLSPALAPRLLDMLPTARLGDGMLSDQWRLDATTTRPVVSGTLAWRKRNSTFASLSPFFLQQGRIMKQYPFQSDMTSPYSPLHNSTPPSASLWRHQHVIPSSVLRPIGMRSTLDNLMLGFAPENHVELVTLATSSLLAESHHSCALLTDLIKE